jgi:predicted dehydrogenase
MMSSAASEPDRPLRGALLGCGSIAPFHLRAWAQIPGVEIVALANRTRSKAEALAGQFGIAAAHVYGDYRELLDNETLDFVDIATAPSVHREQVLAAAAHGRHVLCQKPFATSPQQACAMIAGCRAAGVRCVVNENWRWRSWYRELHTMLAAGTIGVPRYARFQFHADVLLPGAAGELPPLLKVQPYTAQLPRLIVLEWGIHLLDVLRFLFGDVHSVSARMGKVSPLVEGEDWAVITLQFRSGVVGLLDISWVTAIPDEKRLTRGNLDPLVVEGDAGTIELNPYEGDVFIITTAAGTERRPAHPGMTPTEAYQASYVAAQQHFVDCLRSGQPAESEATDNLKTLAIVWAASESADHNRVVFLDDDSAH